MNAFLVKWKNLSPLDRFLNGLILLSSLAVIVLAIFSLCGLWDLSLIVSMPLMAVTMLCQGVVHLRMRSRVTAIISFCSGAVIALCFVISIIL